MFAVWGIMKNEVNNFVKKNELTKAERTTSAGGCRADWIDREAMGHVLAALMPENRLAIEVAIARSEERRVLVTFYPLKRTS